MLINMTHCKTKSSFVIFFPWILFNYCISNNKDIYVPSGYIGCHLSLSIFEALPQKLYASISNNGDDCKHNCSIHDYKLAGTKDTNCFCGNVTTKDTSTGCIMPCPGRGDEICGGTSTMSVYLTTDVSFSTSAPDVETTTIDSLTTEPNRNSTQGYLKTSTGKARSFMKATYITIPLICVGLILSAIAMFLFIRRKRRNKQTNQKLVYKGNKPGETRSGLASGKVTYHGETDTNNDPTYYSNDNAVNTESIESPPVYEYAICENIIQHDNVNAENSSVLIEHDYGHAKHHNMAFAKQAYSHVSNGSETVGQADEYAHIGPVEVMPEREAPCNDRQVFTNNDEAKRTKEDFPYDISQAVENDIQTEQLEEYSTLKY